MHKHLIVLMLTILSAFLLCSAASAQLTENDIETVQTPEISTNSDAMYKYDDLNTYSSQQIENQYIENSNEQNSLKYSLSSQSNTQTNTLGNKQSTTTASSTSQSSSSNTQTNDPADLDVYKNLDANVDITDLNTRTTNATANYNDIVTWYIWVENKGPDAATNVQVTDLIPNGLVYYGAMDPIVPIGSFNSTTGIWSIDTLNSGDLYELIFWTQVRDVGTLTNVANVTSDIPDPNLSDNTWTVNLNVPVPDQTVDLVVYKDSYDYTTEWNYNEIYSFWIYLGNNGPSDATGVTLTDLLPDGLRLPTAQELLDYFGFSLDPAIVSQGYFDTTTMTWYIGDVAAYTDWPTLQLFAKVTGHNTTVTNTANVTSYEYDTNPLDNTASLDITIPPAAYVDLQKEFQDLNGNPIPDINGDTIPDVYFGDYFWSIIKAYNIGPDDIGVSIQDLFDMFLTLQFATDNSGENFYVSFNNGTTWIAGSTLTNMTFTDYGFYGYFNIDNLLKDQSIWIKSYLTTSLYTGLTGNTVDSFIYYGYEWLGPGHATAPLYVLPANLYIEKLIKGTTSATANYKDTIQYIINIGNTGSPAYNVYVDDFLPMGLEITDFYASIGTFYDTGVWIIDVLNTNQTAQLVFNVTVNATGWLNNTATISSDTPEDNLTDNTATAGLFVPAASVIQISKEFWDYGYFGPGAPITTANYYDWVYAVIKVTNNGPDDANISIKDILSPAFITDGWVAVSTDGLVSYVWEYLYDNPDTGIFSYLIPAGSEYWFAIESTVNSTGNITNTVTQTAQDTYNPDYPNGGPYSSAQAILEVPQAAIVDYTKEFRTDYTDPNSVTNTANYHDWIYAIISAVNQGPDTVNVQIQDIPSGFSPNGVYYVNYGTGWLPADGSYSGGVWNITMPALANYLLAIYGQVTATGTINNTAEEIYQDIYNPYYGPWPDLWYQFHSPYYQTTAQLNVPQASIINLSKEFRSTVNGDPINIAHISDWVWAVVTTTNAGPDPANVVYQDTSNGFISQGTYLVSNDGGISWIVDGSYNSTSGVWSINLPAGATYLLALFGQLNKIGLVNNTIAETAQDTYNPFGPDSPFPNPYPSSTAIVDVKPIPAVVSVVPANNSVNVPSNQVITVTFNVPIKAGNNWIELKNSMGSLIPISISINGANLIITPSIALAEDIYKVIVHTGSITDLYGYPVALWSSQFSVGASPIISSVIPANNSVNVPSNQVITVTFNEPIKAGTNWIELKNSIGAIMPISISIVGNTLTITPKVLLPEDKYNIIIHTGSITDLVGNPVALWSSIFIVGTSPNVVSVDPANNSVNVPRDKVITVTFNEAIKAGSNWIELKTSNGTVVPISISIKGNTLTIKASSLLNLGSTYTIVVHTGSLTDLAGNPVALWSSRYTVTTDGTAPKITASNPVNNATGVLLNKTITVTFNEPIKAGTNWIELKASNGTLIPITTSISGNILTINHSALLTASTLYSIIVHTGSITDLMGNPVALWTSKFTTA